MSLRDLRRIFDVSVSEYEDKVLQRQKLLSQNKGFDPLKKTEDFNNNRREPKDTACFRIAPHLIGIQTLLKWKDEDLPLPKPFLRYVKIHPARSFSTQTLAFHGQKTQPPLPGLAITQSLTLPHREVSPNLHCQVPTTP